MRKTKEKKRRSSRSSIKGPILQEIYGVDFQGGNQISWPQPPVHPPLCSAEHIFKKQPTHLLGQLPCWENMRQEVRLSRGPPHQSRSHTETSVGCFPSTRSHLAMIPPTRGLSSSSRYSQYVQAGKCVICRPSWVKRIKNHPLNFSTSFLPTSGPISCVRRCAATLSGL